MELVDDTPYDLIIIGAGAAGSSAAYTLKNKNNNLKILLLEAKDRVGGRTQTLELNASKKQKSKFDAGGQWVTDAQKNVTSLLNELKIETYRQEDVGIKILELNGKVKTYNSQLPSISYTSLLELYLNLFRINSTASKINTLQPFENLRLAQSLDSQNMEQYMHKTALSSTARKIIVAAVTTIFGLPSSQINALFGSMYVSSGGGFEKLSLTEPGCAQEKRIKGGAQQITEKMLERALEDGQSKLLLNHVVLKITQDEFNKEEFVKVKALNRNKQEKIVFKAKRVITSIPPNLYEHVKFVPELPLYKRNVFKSMKMGNLLKFLVTYETQFWKKNGYSAEVISDGSILEFDEQILKSSTSRLNEYKSKPKLAPVNIVFDATNSEGHPALVGFIGAEQLNEWFDLGAEAREKEVIKCLVRWFGKEANDYIQYFEKNWSEEEFTGGCPSVNVTTPGVMQDYVRATREPFLNVHFCGTESATQWQGYIDGAIESGIRAANECLLMDKDNCHLADKSRTYYAQKEAVKQIKNSFDCCYFVKFLFLGLVGLVLAWLFKFF